jgi:hypothetical protein
MHVIGIDLFPNRLQTDVIRCAKHRAGLDPAARKPLGIAPGIVVTSITALTVGSAAKLGCPYDQCLFQQPTRFQIGQKASDGLVHGRGVWGMVLLKFPVSIPSPSTSTGPETTWMKAHIALYQAASAAEAEADAGFPGQEESKLAVVRALLRLILSPNVRMPLSRLQ